MKQMNPAMKRLIDALVLTGLAGVAWHNGKMWQRERSLLTRQPAPQPRPAFEAWQTRPTVSVLVAAWNEVSNIETLVRSFLELCYPAKELILCAGGADGTYDVAQQWAGPRVTVLAQRPGEGKQHALSRCLAQSTGEVILLTDADCELSSLAFLSLIEPIAQGRSVVATGTAEPKACERDSSLVQFQWFTDLVQSHQMPEVVDGVLGRNCALLRSVLEAVGRFDAPVRTGTDYFLSRLLTQAGYDIRAVPDSRVATEYPDSPGAYLHMLRRWNKNLLIHGWRFKHWQDVKDMSVAITLYSAILFTPILTPVLGSTAWVPSLLLFGMANANRLHRLTVGARLTGTSVSRRNLITLPFYTCLDMLGVLLGLRDALIPGLRGRW